MITINDREKVIRLNEDNIDTIIECLCAQLQSAQSLNRAYLASNKRLEQELDMLRAGCERDIAIEEGGSDE